MINPGVEQGSFFEMRLRCNASFQFTFYSYTISMDAIGPPSMTVTTMEKGDSSRRGWVIKHALSP